MASLIYFDFRSLQKTYKSIDTFHRCEQLGKAVSLLGHPCNVTTFRKIRNRIVRHTPLSTITYAHIIMGFFFAFRRRYISHPSEMLPICFYAIRLLRFMAVHGHCRNKKTTMYKLKSDSYTLVASLIDWSQNIILTE